MSEKESSFSKKHLSWIIVGLLIILSLLIIKPYVVPLAAAFILAYLVKPLYARLSSQLNKHLAAFLCILIVLVILILPLSFLVTNITSQTYDAIKSPAFQDLITSISKIPFLENIQFDLTEVSQKGTDLVVGTLSKTFSYLPSLVLALIITLFGTYYILTNWEPLFVKIQTYLPFKDKTTLFKDISKTTNSLIYGSFVIALIEFIVAAISFYVLGIKSYLVLSFLIGLLAFIPGLGPTIIWAPMALFYLLTKSYSTMISVIVVGFILSIGIDAILRSKLMSRNSNSNPLVILIGILGGIPLFGIAGIIIGPLVLIYTLRLLQEIIKEEKSPA